jgi:hypothetical protein
MERFLWEHLLEYWWRASCESIFGMDLLSMIEDLFWEREREEDLMDASKFRQCRRSWWKNSRSFRNPSLWGIRGLSIYIEGIRGLTVYRERIVDKIMEICVWAGAKLLDDEAGSRSAFYGLRSITETLVCLHYCLDGYYCLMCCECLGNSWYGFYDVVQFGWFGWWSEKYSFNSVVTWLLWYTSCLYMIDISFILISCGVWASCWRAWMYCDWLVVSLDSQR